MGRFIIGGLVGAVVTVALMYLMQALIFTNANLIPEDRDDFEVTITREDIDEPEDPQRPTLPPRPDPNDVPPPLEPMEPIVTSGIGGITYHIPSPEPGIRGGDIVIPTVFRPLVRVEPDYPRAALQNGTEGFAIVGFSVAPDGSTADAEILASEPGTIFDAAAIRAVNGWIYQPRTDADGNAITVDGQTARFNFNMSDDSGE